MVGQMSANQLMNRLQRDSDNYWPDLHRLLQEPNNATPSIRFKAVIDNPHLTDSYIVSRLDEFSNLWLDRVLQTEWKWHRFEWQARGITHAHGRAKLRNDPGVCNLVNTAVQGWKLSRLCNCKCNNQPMNRWQLTFNPKLKQDIKQQQLL